MELAVYVPTDPAQYAIDPGSGIVGTMTEGGRLLVDYEGNRFGSTNMVTFADRVHVAAGRHLERYPTVARKWVRPETMRQVGWFDTDTGEVTLDGPEGPDVARTELAGWCGAGTDDLTAQLATRGSARHLMRREIAAAMASGDPAQRFAAQQMAKRYDITP